MRGKSLHLFVLSAVIALVASTFGTVAAQEAIKIGLVMPMTGVLGPVGEQAAAWGRGCRLQDRIDREG